jgi:hypothetical protein
MMEGSETVCVNADDASDRKWWRVERPEGVGGDKGANSRAHLKPILDCVFLFRVMTCQQNLGTLDKIKTSNKTSKVSHYFLVRAASKNL